MFKRLPSRWVLALIAAVLLTLAALAAGLVGDLPAPTPEALRPIRPSTLIVDRNGRLLYEVIGEHGKQTPLTFEQIPAACWQATVSVEDGRFFQHPGVDFLAIARSAWLNLRSGQVLSGASTLTQQLARNTLLTADERYEQSLRRKLREAWLAWRIEQRYSKQEILALYLNQVYFGNFAYGLEAAAEAYFGKPAQELDLAECSLLAGLLQNPSLYNPLQDLDAARWRQATVLSLMVWNGYIGRQDAELALAETLHFAATPFPIEAPHFVSFVEGQLATLLGPEQLRQGGLRVFTTLDLSWQHEAEQIVQHHLQRLRDEPDAPADRRIDNAALVSLDPATGAILTMVGSPDYFDAAIDGAVNAAVALRQPGSAIKPFTYAAAMDPARSAAAGRQPLTAASVIADVRTVFTTAEGEPYVPENYDRQWHGPVSVRTALASSYNTPAVKVLSSIGVEALLDQARRLGITTFRPDRLAAAQVLNTDQAHPSSAYGLALTLGGGEVSLVELTGAYAAYANGGRRVEPYAVERVEDSAGNLLFQADHSRSQDAAHQALDPRVAFLITDILADNDARAPSFGRNSVLRLDRPAAVKTGTTTDWRDNWTIGYTPQVVTGVWVGNADNTPMLGISGVTGAGPIWHDFMLAVHQGLPVQRFRPPEGIVRTEVCIDSGLLPTDWCTRRRSELFVAGTEPTQFDTVNQPPTADACADGHTGDCLARQDVRAYPPELHEWASDRGLPAALAAAQPPAGSTQDVSAAFTFTSPDPNGVFRLSPALPADAQQLRLAGQVLSGEPVAAVTFLVDGQPVAEVTHGPYEAWWPLQRGRHQIGAVVQAASGRTIAVEPLWVEVR